VVSTPSVQLTDGPGGPPCRAGLVQCNLLVTADASDPESGIADLRIMLAFGMSCTDGSDSIILDAHIPSPMGSTDQDRITASRVLDCPNGRTIENASVSVFARATDGAGLTTDSSPVTASA
jgi:hypothetical protein